MTNQSEPPKEPVNPRHNVWFLEHGLYKCGNCRKATAYLDISERPFCYNCGHVMRWYEKDGELKPIRFGYNKDYDAKPNMHFTY